MVKSIFDLDKRLEHTSDSRNRIGEKFKFIQTNKINHMKKTIVLSIGVLLFWSCNNAEKKITSAEEEVRTEHHHHEDQKPIELDNGGKWAVNEEMKIHVLKGEELVNNYLVAGLSDYKTLAEQVKEQNDQLIKSCTMKGKSHDELHKWLHPHLETVKKLEQETDAGKANEIVLQLQHSYKEYHNYFQ